LKKPGNKFYDQIHVISVEPKTVTYGNIPKESDSFEYNDDLSQLDKSQIVEQNLKQELSASPTSSLETMLQKKTEHKVD
jgi:hypothetical protein